MDRSLREMGVGDLSVPKRMKRMAEAYYGRAAAYDAALAAEDRAALAAAMRRNVLRGRRRRGRGVAAYAAEAAGRLACLPATDLRAGRLAWPDPAAIPRAEPGMSDTLPFSRPIDVSAIPATGVDRTIKAEAARTGSDRRAVRHTGSPLALPPSSSSGGRRAA